MRHDVIVHLDDVRDAAVSRDGSTGVANRGVWLRHLHEHRAGAQDLGGRLVLYA